MTAPLGSTPLAPKTITAELIAVIVAVTGSDPRVLTIDGGAALPCGPLSPEHRSLQAGLRAWVERQTHHPLGTVEQLYTFADNNRGADPGQGGSPTRAISISYLGLTRESERTRDPAAAWQSWYRYFPWEDRREGAAARETPPPLTAEIARRLEPWIRAGSARAVRAERAAAAFGLEGRPWNEDFVLQRYELLYEAGLVPEARRDGVPAMADPLPGQPMKLDHRRILATGIARLRAKIGYRPVVFELMPDEFTLLDLQRTVETLAGRPLHKQNFRRLVAQQNLVEETGAMSTTAFGRPAKLFRFRPELLARRAQAGTKPPLARG